jgi:hypothetical protein
LPSVSRTILNNSEFRLFENKKITNILVLVIISGRGNSDQLFVSCFLGSVAYPAVPTARLDELVELWMERV